MGVTNWNSTKRMSNINKIIKHTLSKKSLFIRAFTFIWVVICSWFWTGDPIKSLELSISILIGSMLIQGFLEWVFDKNHN